MTVAQTDRATLKQLEAAHAINAGVIAALRHIGDTWSERSPLDIIMVMQRAEATEYNIHNAVELLRRTSPRWQDYIGKVIMEEACIEGIISWVVTDYEENAETCTIEKRLDTSVDSYELLITETMPFNEVREYRKAWTSAKVTV